jgi:hypothetical protein
MIIMMYIKADYSIQCNTFFIFFDFFTPTLPSAASITKKNEIFSKNFGLSVDLPNKIM